MIESLHRQREGTTIDRLSSSASSPRRHPHNSRQISTNNYRSSSPCTAVSRVSQGCSEFGKLWACESLSTDQPKHLMRYSFRAGGFSQLLLSFPNRLVLTRPHRPLNKITKDIFMDSDCLLHTPVYRCYPCTVIFMRCLEPSGTSLVS